MQIVLSNDLEELAQALFRQIDQSDPFVQRIVFVQGPAMKAWLLEKLVNLAPERAVSGMTFLSFDALFSFSLDKETHLPTPLEWRWAIEQAIREIYAANEEEASLFQPLRNWVSSTISTPKDERRLARLSRQLSRAFVDYSHFGGSIWEIGKFADGELVWQKALYERILSRFPHWRVPEAILESAKEYEVKRPTEIHIFSQNFLSRKEYALLEILDATSPVFWYLLSPCALFWGDVASDRERHRLQTRWEKQGLNESTQEELEDYLRDRHTLLANFGRLGRETVSLLENHPKGITPLYRIVSGCATRQEYAPFLDPDAVHPKEGEPTLLARLQSDLLLLRTAWKNPQEIPAEQPCSMQVHAAPSLFREVEILYHNLLSLLHHEKGALVPSDILVMAPDITLYRPFIEAVFGGIESLLPYHVIDEKLPLHNPYIKTMVRLLDLAESRWDLASVFALVQSEPFRKRQGWKGEGVEKWRLWMEREGLEWGFNTLHREKILRRSHRSSESAVLDGVTWESASSRLLRGLALVDDPTASEELSLPEAEEFGAWVATIRTLWQALEPLVDGTEATLQGWGEKLTELARYFEPEAWDTEGKEAFAELTKILQLFHNASPLLTYTSTFRSLREDLLSLLSRPSLRFREGPLEVVRFCSMRPMRTIPAGVIALLGMSEEAFPREPEISAVHRLRKEPGSEYIPTTTDYDRYLFLEACISCRKYFLLSYPLYRYDDGKMQPPSLLVQELLHEIEKGYSIAQGSLIDAVRFVHPQMSYDRDYFLYDSRLANFSQSDFYRSQILEEPPPLLPKNTTGLTIKKTLEKKRVDLQELTRLARHPLEFFFRQSMQIVWNKERFTTSQRLDLANLPPLTRYRLSRMTLENPKENAMANERQRGSFPYGVWGDIAESRIHADLAKTEAWMGGGLPPFLQLHFSPHIKTPTQKGEREWLFPALPVRGENDEMILITGTIKEGSERGLLLWQHETTPNLVSLLPKLLLFQYAAQLVPDHFPASCLFLRSRKERELQHGDPIREMQRWIEYWCEAQKSPSPLLPEWVEYFLRCEKEEIYERIRQSNNEATPLSRDLYVQKFFAFSHPPDTLAVWTDVAQALFHHLFTKKEGRE